MHWLHKQNCAEPEKGYTFNKYCSRTHKTPTLCVHLHTFAVLYRNIRLLTYLKLVYSIKMPLHLSASCLYIGQSTVQCEIDITANLQTRTTTSILWEYWLITAVCCLILEIPTHTNLKLINFYPYGAMLVWILVCHGPVSCLLPPPKKEVMFLVRSVCLYVRRITRKLVNGFWQNFLEE